MANVPSVTLNNGEKMPGFGLGTFEVSFANFSFRSQRLNGKFHWFGFFYVFDFCEFLFGLRLSLQSVYDSNP